MPINRLKEMEDLRQLLFPTKADSISQGLLPRATAPSAKERAQARLKRLEEQGITPTFSDSLEAYSPNEIEQIRKLQGLTSNVPTNITGTERAAKRVTEQTSGGLLPENIQYPGSPLAAADSTLLKLREPTISPLDALSARADSLKDVETIRGIEGKPAEEAAKATKEKDKAYTADRDALIKDVLTFKKSIPVEFGEEGYTGEGATKEVSVYNNTFLRKFFNKLEKKGKLTASDIGVFSDPENDYLTDKINELAEKYPEKISTPTTKKTRTDRSQALPPGSTPLGISEVTGKTYYMLPDGSIGEE